MSRQGPDMHSLYVRSEVHHGPCNEHVLSTRRRLRKVLLTTILKFENHIQGVPENLCPVCLKIATKRQEALTILLLDVALQMFN